MNDIVIALKSIYRNFRMSLVAMSLIIMTMLIFSITIITVVNGIKLTDTVATNLEIVVYLDKGLTQEQIDAAGQNISKIDGVENITRSTKEEELNDLVATFPTEEQQMLVDLFSGENNPLYDVYIVNLKSLAYDRVVVETQISQIDGVYKIPSDVTGVGSIIDFLKMLIIVGIAAVLFLFSVTIFLINSTINLTINARKKEIGIMKLVGATNMKVRKPFLYEGMILGFIGGLIAAILVALFYSNFLDMSIMVLFRNKFVTAEFVNTHILLYIPLVSVVIGAFSSATTINKHLKV